MLDAVQLLRGQVRSFTRGFATMSTIRIRLVPGEALVINRGFNHTTFVKCGKRIVTSTRVVSLKVGQTAIVRCARF